MAVAPVKWVQEAAKLIASAGGGNGLALELFQLLPLQQLLGSQLGRGL